MRSLRVNMEEMMRAVNEISDEKFNKVKTQAALDEIKNTAIALGIKHWRTMPYKDLRDKINQLKSANGHYRLGN